MERKMVYHHNYIGHEINESLMYYANDVFDREIYCRKKHNILEPLESDCELCPYFAGLEQGRGHECAWEDVVEEDYFIQHEDRYKEFERVDKLLKTGVIGNTKKNLIEKVKELTYDEGKWIYKQSDNKFNRFLLGEIGNNNLICCGVNPSKASPEDLDATMRKVSSLAKANGYDGYIMINLYPMRATDPNDMHDNKDEEIVKINLESIAEVLKDGCDIWAAWGTLIEKRDYLKECLEQIVELADSHDCKWCAFGPTTKAGHPRHPLYLSSKCVKNPFDVHEYLQKLR